MNAVKIADLKNNLSRHIAMVRRGGEITVYDRDTPVARIVPFDARDAAARGRSTPESAASADRMADLVREGVLSTGDPQALAGWLETRRALKLPAGRPGAVEALLTMRRESKR